jgi:MFS family permease
MILLIFDVAINNTSNLLLEQVFSRISQKHRGKTFSLRSISANLGGIIGPLIGGLAWDYIGIRTPFFISIFVELSLIPLFIIALTKLLGNLEEK